MILIMDLSATLPNNIDVARGKPSGWIVLLRLVNKSILMSTKPNIGVETIKLLQPMEDVMEGPTLEYERKVLDKAMIICVSMFLKLWGDRGGLKDREA